MKRLITVFTILTLAACASPGLERRLDEKLARDQVETRGELDAKASALLERTPGLSAKQKTDLEALKASTRERLRRIYREQNKLNAILVEDVLSPGDHATELRAVKKRLRDLARERIDAIFDAVNEANDVLGRSALLREAMDLQMLDDQARD